MAGNRPAVPWSNNIVTCPHHCKATAHGSSSWRLGSRSLASAEHHSPMSPRSSILHSSQGTGAAVPALTMSLQRTKGTEPVPGRGDGKPLAGCRAFGGCGWARTFSGAVKPENNSRCFSLGSQTKAAREHGTVAGGLGRLPGAAGFLETGRISAPRVPAAGRWKRQLLRKLLGDSGRNAATMRRGEGGEGILCMESWGARMLRGFWGHA